MAIVFFQKFMDLSSVGSINAEFETTETFFGTGANTTVDGTTGITTASTESNNCADGNTRNANGTTTVNNKNTSVGGGQTIYATNIGSTNVANGITIDIIGSSQTTQNRTTISNLETRRTVNSTGGQTIEATPFYTVQEFDDSVAIPETAFGQNETTQATTQSEALQVVTSTEITAVVTFAVGTTTDGGDVTTTQGSLTTTQGGPVATTIARIYDTIIYDGIDYHTNFCTPANETVYRAGECEKYRVYAGAGAMEPVTDYAVTEYIHTPATTQITTNYTTGNSTIGSTFDAIADETFTVKMTTLEGQINMAAKIITGVFQSAESSGTNHPAGTTYSIAVAGSVTDTDQQTLRALGTVRVRQLGNVSLVNTVNGADTLVVMGLPSDSTTVVGGRGYGDLGDQTVTFERGIYDATSILGSTFGKSTITQETELTQTVANGIAWTAKPIKAFASVAGSFPNQLEIDLQNCCATTLLI